MPAMKGGRIKFCGSGFSREYRWDLFAAEAAPTIFKTTISAVKKTIAGMARSQLAGLRPCLNGMPVHPRLTVPVTVTDLTGGQRHHPCLSRRWIE